MAKKDNKVSEIEVGTSSLNNATLSAPQTSKPAKTKKKDSQTKKKGFFSKLGIKLKEMFSEMKKVTWLTPKDTFKKLGIVILVVFVFLILVMGFDSLCFWLLQLLLQTK